MDQPYYYLRFWEGMVLLLASAELIVAGVIIKRHWGRNNEPLPIWLATLMWIGMAALYITMACVFYQTTGRNLLPEDAVHQKFRILMYCILFFLVPFGYFTNVLRHAWAWNIVDHIGPFSAQIADPSEFAAARKLALRGDIDGAVARYREYHDNEANALFEAARLLKSEDRFQDAARLYDEVAERFYGRRRVWAEALYHLAKLHEVTLNDGAKAVELYRKILDRAPESRFGQLAGADLARMQVLRGDVVEADTEGPEAAPAEASPDPFHRPRTRKAVLTPGDIPADVAAAVTAVAAPPPPETAPPEEVPDLVVPVQDPFYRTRMQARAAALAEKGGGAEPEDGREAAQAASIPKKRKQAAAKKKPAVRRRKA
ncbi:MAG: tetratricopeptide repeat protein [Candidatus Hydrogenedentes bacterium]|nr:tetratricopeptide repeat protein [Candidatus Hydrogenedentota bacterium]